MQRELVLKAVENSIDPGTKDLFNVAFGHERSDAEWSWKYVNAPLGFYAIRAFDNDIVACQYGGILYCCFIGGEERRVFQVIDIMTRPAYRSGFVLMKAVNALIEYCCSRLDVTAMFGFTANVSRQFGIYKLGYCAASPLGYLRKSTFIGQQRPAHHLFTKVSNTTEIDNKADRIWKENKEIYRICLRKNADYLRWRYLDAPFHYEIFECYSGFRRNFAGYLIFREYRGGIGLTDIIIRAIYNEKIPAFLNEVERIYLLDTGVSEMITWGSPNSPYYCALVDYGFAPLKHPDNLYFTFRIYNDSIDNSSFDNSFFYTMGDCESFSV
jgi:hypothetical protein